MHRPIAITAPWTKLVCCWHPPDRTASGEIAVELVGSDTQGARRIANHYAVPETGRNLTIRPQALGEKRPEKLVGHDAIMTQPVRMRAKHRT